MVTTRRVQLPDTVEKFVLRNQMRVLVYLHMCSHRLTSEDGVTYELYLKAISNVTDTIIRNPYSAYDLEHARRGLLGHRSGKH